MCEQLRRGGGEVREGERWREKREGNLVCWREVITQKHSQGEGEKVAVEVTIEDLRGREGF